MARTEILKTLDFCAIDTETTGFSPKSSEIIEVAMIRFRNGQPVKKLHTLICPEKLPLPRNIIKLTHIYTEDVVDKPRISEVIDNAAAFLGDDIIVGQNPTFDVRFLEAAGIGSIDAPIVDTVRIAKRVYPKLENNKLETIIARCAKEGMPIWPGNAHRADWDAIMTGYCYVHMLDALDIA